MTPAETAMGAAAAPLPVDLPGWDCAPVALDRIGAALDDQWDGACTSEDDVAVPTRTLTCNLMVVGEDPVRMTGALNHVAARHACRTFLIVMGPEADPGDGLTAHLLTRQRPPSTGPARPPAGPPDEVVLIHAAPDAMLRLVGVIRPLLVTDIPCHLHWGIRLEGHLDRLRILAELCEHMSLDSARFPDPIIEFGLLQSLRTAQPLVPVDLSHYRLGPWRRGLAMGFEHLPFDPAEETGIRLTHTAQPASAGACVTLSRWLRRRLGAEVELVRIEGEDDGPLQVDLRHGSGRITVRREGALLVVEVETGDRCLLPFTVAAPRRHTGELLADAVAGVV